MVCLHSLSKFQQLSIYLTRVYCKCTKRGEVFFRFCKKVHHFGCLVEPFFWSDFLPSAKYWSHYSYDYNNSPCLRFETYHQMINLHMNIEIKKKSMTRKKNCNFAMVPKGLKRTASSCCKKIPTAVRKLDFNVRPLK